MQAASSASQPSIRAADPGASAVSGMSGAPIAPDDFHDTFIAGAADAPGPGPDQQGDSAAAQQQALAGVTGRGAGGAGGADGDGAGGSGADLLGDLGLMGMGMGGAGMEEPQAEDDWEFDVVRDAE